MRRQHRATGHRTGRASAQAATVQAGPAQPGRVSIVIDSMSPQVAGPGATITVTGTASNGTSQAKAGLDVQLYTSPTRFASRDAMEAYATQGGIAGLQPAGNPIIDGVIVCRQGDVSLA